MENLNAEQIKKELALFIDDMPHQLHLRERKTAKFRVFLENVLSLIKELTEDKKKSDRVFSDLYKEAETYLTQRECLRNQVKNLTEKNARLDKLCALRDRDNKDTQDLLYKAEAKNAELEKKYALAVAERGANVKGFSDTLATIRADTVKNIAGLLWQGESEKMNISVDGKYYSKQEFIDQFAKELTLAKEERDAENEKEEAF